MDAVTIDRYVNYIRKQKSTRIPFAIATGVLFHDESTILTIYEFWSGLAHCPDSYQFVCITRDDIVMMDENQLCDLMHIDDRELPDAYDFLEFWIENENAEKYENQMRRKYGFPDR